MRFMAERYRTVAFLVYPESLPYDELVERISESHIPAFISPLHSADVKHTKEHYHVLFMYDAQKAVSSIQEDVIACGGANGFFITPPKRTYARYLLHLDNPEKEQFPDDTVTELNGASFRPYFFSSDDEEISSEVSFILNIINRDGITTFRGLVDKCSDDWLLLGCLRKNTFFFQSYLKS